MKKFSKSGPPARAERSERPARKSYARDGAAPKRTYAPRGEAPTRPYAPRTAAGSAPRRSNVRDDVGAAPARSAYGNPYERAQRPRRSDESEAPRGAAGRGFTVSLDPDVARVFRGDASVNKALRLVLQLMQVVEGPGPRSDRSAPRARTGYQGSDEARGFARKPRFVERDDDEDVE